MNIQVAPIRQFQGVTPDSFVIQANSLARAKYGAAANIHGLRLIAVAIAKVDQDMDLLNQVVITNSELRAIFPAYGHTKNLSAYVADAADRMMTLRAETWERDGEWRKVNVVSEAKYRPGKGGLTITFHPEMKQFLLRLTGSYTKYQLRVIAQLSTSYQFQLYQFLKSHSHHGRVALSVPDLRTLLDVDAKAYSAFKDFRRRVLEPSIAAINQYTDIAVSFDAELNGRTCVGVLFKISQNVGVESLFDKGAVAVLKNFGLSESAAKDAVRSHHCMPCLKLLAAVKARAKTTRIENLPAYLARLLQKGIQIQTDHPEFAKTLEEVYAEFRVACYAKLEEHEKHAWLSEFKKELEGQDLFDLERRGPMATPSLRQRFTAFLRANLNPDTPNFRLSA